MLSFFIMTVLCFTRSFGGSFGAAEAFLFLREKHCGGFGGEAQLAESAAAREEIKCETHRQTPKAEGDLPEHPSSKSR